MMNLQVRVALVLARSLRELAAVESLTLSAYVRRELTRHVARRAARAHIHGPDLGVWSGPPLP